jgi:hypothetical protein
MQGAASHLPHCHRGYRYPSIHNLDDDSLLYIFELNPCGPALIGKGEDDNRFILRGGYWFAKGDTLYLRTRLSPT